MLVYVGDLEVSSFRIVSGWLHAMYKRYIGTGLTQVREKRTNCE